MIGTGSVGAVGERGRPSAASGTAEADFAIRPRGPFAWATALDMLANWAPVARFWTGEAGPLRLAFPLDGDFRTAAVALWAEGGELQGRVSGGADVARVQRQVARMFSLDADGTGYPEVGRRDPAIGRLMVALPGLRPVLFPSPYEAAAWAVISQRISTRQAARVQVRLVAEHGDWPAVAGAEVGCFPTPRQLARLSDVPGLSAEKVERLRGVAKAALDGLLDADRLRALGDEAAPAALRAIPGIGPFWSQGIYLRACGIADAFPEEPTSLHALAAVRGLPEPPRGEELRRLAEVYRPYRMWVCVLLRVAAGRGLVPG